MDAGLVCDTCSTLNPMESLSCSRCNAAISLTPTGQAALRAPPAVGPGTGTAQHAAAGISCAACGAPIPPGFKFCGACGTPIAAAAAAGGAVAASDALQMPDEPTRQRSPGSSAGGGKQTMFFSSIQASHAKLVLIKGDGLDGVSFTLAGEEHTAGRGDAALRFDEDPFLSPIHANFFYRDRKLFVRDENSANGVYLRIQGGCPLQIGDQFLVGEQLLGIADAAGDTDAASERPTPDGTYYFCSLHRPSSFRIVQQLRGGDTGIAFSPSGDAVTLGREGNDINFPDDPFISGHHAQVSAQPADHAGGASGSGPAGADFPPTLRLNDLNSKNGTFLRIRGEQKLNHGDYVFMGQQLLRVEIV